MNWKKIAKWAGLGLLVLAIGDAAGIGQVQIINTQIWGFLVNLPLVGRVFGLVQSTIRQVLPDFATGSH